MIVALYAEFAPVTGCEPLVTRLIADYAEQVRGEPGNLQFDAHHVRGQHPSVFVFERYRDRAAFETHLASDHGRVFNQRLAPLIIGGASRLTMLDPIPSTDSEEPVQ